jgi:hypothetical protein
MTRQTLPSFLPGRLTSRSHFQPTLAGREAFANRFNPKRKLLVGAQGIPLEEFLVQPAAYWLQ